MSLFLAEETKFGVMMATSHFQMAEKNIVYIYIYREKMEHVIHV